MFYNFSQSLISFDSQIHFTHALISAIDYQLRIAVGCNNTIVPCACNIKGAQCKIRWLPNEPKNVPITTYINHIYVNVNFVKVNYENR